MRRYIFIFTVLALIVSGKGIAFSKSNAEIVKKADWSKMKKASVELGEYHFKPKTLHFRSDTPYMLTITNRGKTKHYFVARKFFKGIVLRKVQTSDGEIKAPYLTAIEVFPGKSLDLYFVPVEKGSYNLTCTIKGHAEKGMTGKIKID